MSRLAFPFVAAFALACAPRVLGLAPVPSACATVGLGVALAVAASGVASARAVAAGALAALGAGILAPASGLAAGAALGLAVFAERTSRVRSAGMRAAHLAGATLAGAFGGHLVASFAGGATVLLVVAAAVAAAALSVPLLVDADDPVTAELAGVARALGGEPGAPFARAVQLRRGLAEQDLPRDVRAPLERTFASLLALGDVKVRLVRRLGPYGTADKDAPGAAVRLALEDRIAEHVALVERALRAVAERAAAEITLEAAADGQVTAADAEALEHESEALVRAEA